MIREGGAADDVTPAPPSTSRPAVPVWLDRLAAIGWRVIAVSALGIVIAAIAVARGYMTGAGTWCPYHPMT